MPPVSLISVGRQIATGVVDTGGKFVAGIFDIGDKFVIGINNTSEISDKICAGVFDTSGKFSPGVVDTSSNFGGAHCLANIAANVKKNLNGPNGILWGWGRN